MEPVSATFGFSRALELLKEGKVVTRMGWNNPNISVHLQVPDENSKMTKPYLYMEKSFQNTEETVGGVDRFPLDLSCESIMAEDWCELIA